MEIPPEVIALATDLAKTGALALLAYIAHSVRSVKAAFTSHEDRIKRLETIVTGVDGNNGLRTAVGHVEDKVEAHGERLTRLEAA